MKNKKPIIILIVFIIGVLIGSILFGIIQGKQEHNAPGDEIVNESNTVTGDALSLSDEALEVETTSESVLVTADAVSAIPTKTETLHVSGSQLVDAAGNPVQLKGISTHGIAWYPDYINEAFFKELSENWNADVVRLAMYTAENSGYCSGGNKENLKNLIKSGVDYATKHNLYVIIDWHILSDGNPHTYKEEAKAFFSEMSALYANHNNVFYEICNEPNGGTSWAQIKSYAEEIIPVIRANDSDGIILVGTPNWSQYVNEAAENPITGYSNIMYTLHFYADTHRDSLRNTMKNAVSAGLPIFVTEYGICDASGNGAINTDQANEWVRTMNSLGISYVAWNISNKNESSAIFNSSCRKTSGFSQDDLSTSGKWLYEMLTGKTKLEGNSNSQQNNSSSTNAASAVANATLSYELTLVSQWEANGETFYQYTATVRNNTGSACSSWNISIPFNDAVKLSNGWNGNYTVNGSTLSVTSVDYNGAIASDGTTGDIGFIVSGSSSLTAN